MAAVFNPFDTTYMAKYAKQGNAQAQPPATQSASPSQADIKNYVDNLIAQKGDAAASDIVNAMQEYNVGLEDVASAYGMSTNDAANWLTSRGVAPDQIPYKNWKAASTPSLTPQEARNMTEQSMLTGVPTSEFNKYGGYDAVYSLAQQAGLGGTPSLNAIAQANAQGKLANSSYSYDFDYHQAPGPASDKNNFFSFVPQEYRQYIPNQVDDYATLAALAIAHDPANRNKSFDQIDWSFLKPKDVPQYANSAPPAPPAVNEYNAVTRDVNPETDTVQGQLEKILNEDSPLMRRARAMALARMAGRGLLNSSLATTAGYAAMIDKALPIAQQDAQTYFKQGLTNQDYRNQAELTNVNWKNKFLENSYVTQLDFWKQSNLMAQQHGYDLEKLDFQNQLKKDLLATEYSFKDKLQQAQLDNQTKELYLKSYQDMLKQLDAILVDPNTDDKSKKKIINNYIESVNKLKASLSAVGQDIPGFDFSAYYVD